ncbi:MAG: aspartate-semialdehyde dehydrogenase [Clostridiaceae bacterium]|nr:aspartate-semialdehyde dehydrogenase [Clostridiaceae bacterium]
MEKSSYKVGVIGCTGMVGQRLVTLLCAHPWFQLSALAAGPRSAGKSYGEAVQGRWKISVPMPESVSGLPVLDAQKDAKSIAEQCDLIFCAVSLPTDETRALEELYARLECVVISNNSACRLCADVPMVIPEINPEHLKVLPFQRKRLGTRRGCIAAKCNCSIQSYVPPLHALWDLRPERVAVCTFQAVSGAGRTMDAWPEMRDNVVPYIRNEEEKSQREPLKLWGKVEGGAILPSAAPIISAQCLRVPVSDGHMAAVFASFRYKVHPEEMRLRIAEYEGLPQHLRLPSAPTRFLHYFDEPDRPQTALDRDLENGMAISVGRLRPCDLFSVKFVCLSHNTLRGAAGGAVELAELLCAQGYLEEGTA